MSPSNAIFWWFPLKLPLVVEDPPENSQGIGSETLPNRSAVDR